MGLEDSVEPSMDFVEVAIAGPLGFLQEGCCSATEFFPLRLIKTTCLSTSLLNVDS